MKIKQTILPIILFAVSILIFLYRFDILFPEEHNFTLEIKVKGGELDRKTQWYFLGNNERGVLDPVLFRKMKNNDSNFLAFHFKKNKVLLEGYIERPGLYVLTNNKLNGFFAFMIDTTYQSIEIKHHYLFQKKGLLEPVPFICSGSILNLEFMNFWKEKEAQPLLAASKDYYDWLEENTRSKFPPKQTFTSNNTDDPHLQKEKEIFIAQNKNKLAEINSLKLTTAISYLIRNPNSYLALDYFLAYVYRPNFSKLDETTLRSYMSLFGDSLKKTAVYKSIVKKYKAIQNFCVGKLPPPIELPNNFEKKVKLTEYKGKITLVHFWKMDCPYCDEERGNMLKLYDKYHEKEFDILSITFDTDKNEWKNYLKKNRIPWQELIDTTGFEHSSMIRAYGGLGIPSSFLLDAEGKVIATYLRCPAYAKEPEYNMNSQLEKVFGF